MGTRPFGPKKCVSGLAIAGVSPTTPLEVKRGDALLAAPGSVVVVLVALVEPPVRPRVGRRDAVASVLRASSATSAPSRASRRAVAAPVPLLAPVTSTRLPRRRRMHGFCLRGVAGDVTAM